MPITLIFFLTALGAVAIFFGVITVIKTRRRASGAHTSTSGDSVDDIAVEFVNQRKAKKDRRRLNLRYAQDAPFFFISDDEVWTGVHLESTQDEFMTFDEEVGHIAELTDTYTGVLKFFQQFGKEFKGSVRCHEITRYQPVNVSQWKDSYDAVQWNPSALFSSLIDTGVAPHIADSTPERQRMLLVRLGTVKKQTIMNPIDGLFAADSGIVNEYFAAEEMDAFRQRARMFFARMADYGATPMERADLSWLVRKTFSGHHQPAEERSYEQTMPWRNTFFDRWADLDGDNLGDCVRISVPDPDGGNPTESFVTTLVVSDAETFVPFTRQNAWGKILRSLPYPAEVSWRFSLIAEEEWAKMIEKQARNILDERNNRNDAAKMPHGSLTGRPLFDEKVAAVEDLRHDLELQPRPAMIGQLRITLSAPTRTELADAAREVANKLSGTVTMERRRNVQLALLEEQLPGKVNTARIGGLAVTARTGGLVGGERFTDIEMLPMARLDSSPRVGDGIQWKEGRRQGWIGHFIGYSRENGAIVHFDPHVQIARNAGAGVAIIGASGGGKSTLSLMLFFWMSESGVQCVVADPKDDFRAFCYYIAFGSQVNDPRFDDVMRTMSPSDPEFPYTVVNPDFWANTQIVNLWHGAPGMLDPFVLENGNFTEGASLASDIFQMLLPDKGERRIAERALAEMGHDYERATAAGEPFALGLGRVASYIAKDIDYFRDMIDGTDADGNRPSVTDRMNAEDRIREREDVMERLRSAAKQQYSKLLFGVVDGSDVGFRQLAARRTVITLQNLKVDSSKPIEQWSPAQRNAAAALYTALHQITTFFMAGDEKHKPNGPADAAPARPPRALFVDEGYVLANIPAGKQLIQVALRQGRSYNFAVIFITQQAKDIAELQAENRQDKKDASVNQFPTIFAFRQGGIDEAVAALRLLRTSTTDDIDDETMDLALRLTAKEGNLATGMCVMKDVDNHVGVVVTDPLFQELWAATQTNPQDRGEYQNVDPPADGANWTVLHANRDHIRTGVTTRAVDELNAAVGSGEFEMDDWSRQQLGATG